MIMGNLSNGDLPKTTSKGNIDPSQKTPLLTQSISGQWSVTIKTPGIQGDTGDNQHQGSQKPGLLIPNNKSHEGGPTPDVGGGVSPQINSQMHNSASESQKQQKMMATMMNENLEIKQTEKVKTKV